MYVALLPCLQGACPLSAAQPGVCMYVCAIVHTYRVHTRGGDGARRCRIVATPLPRGRDRRLRGRRLRRGGKRAAPVMVVSEATARGGATVRWLGIHPSTPSLAHSVLVSGLYLLLWEARRRAPAADWAGRLPKEGQILGRTADGGISAASQPRRASAVKPAVIRRPRFPQWGRAAGHFTAADCSHRRLHRSGLRDHCNVNSFPPSLPPSCCPTPPPPSSISPRINGRWARAVAAPGARKEASGRTSGKKGTWVDAPGARAPPQGRLRQGASGRTAGEWFRSFVILSCQAT